MIDNLTVDQYEIIKHEYHRQLRYGNTHIQPIMCYRMAEYDDKPISITVLDTLVSMGFFERRHYGPATYGDCDYRITPAGMQWAESQYTSAVNNGYIA